MQSPINIPSAKVVQNSNVNFVLNYMQIENATLIQADNNGSLYIDMSQYTTINTLDFWNEFNEHFQYYLDSFRWKIPSEHTIDNH